ncbi:MAG: SIR2 family protein [Elusimicrobia bacterium]|nr:SIR2 family protein [Elusimicrobiota bacterium]
MAKLFQISCPAENDRIIEGLRKAVQSANINFLIGSGCGKSAIPPLGNIENEIQKLITDKKNQEAEKRLFQFLRPFLESTAEMSKPSPSDPVKTAIELHRQFLEVLSQILIERKSNILTRQATIFSTNYDLFIERAFEGLDTPVRLNDGFKRCPTLMGSFKFSSSEYFNTMYNNGTVYNYQVELPSINLVKLHGSLSWNTSGREILFSTDHFDDQLKKYNEISASDKYDQIETFNQKFSIVLPTKEKLKDTLLKQTYYDLLRVYANTLDRENTILIVEGFSFSDEHLLEITRRALKNPTLKVVIFSHSKDEVGGFKNKFQSFNNVEIVYSETDPIEFQKFNALMAMLPPSEITPAKAGSTSK